jgi:signal transduction histidine kinase
VKELPALDTDAAGARQAPDLVHLRHDRLRRTAPAVQHEVNNALMVLASNLELLGRTAAEGPPRRQLDRAQEAMRRLDETVRGFLDAARREAEERAALSPGVALKQMAPLLRVALGARYGFDHDPGQEVWEAELDRARLDLALLALVRDAVGRMANGSRIAARAENRPPAEVALVLTLPAGAEPAGEAADLLAGAATATGGRLERLADGLALVWPRGRPAAAMR